MAEHLLSTDTRLPLQLHSFDQLLFDQLMPWLPENNKDLFYRAWQQYFDTDSTTPNLHRLILVFERNNRQLKTGLRQEWLLIGNNKLTPLMQEIYIDLKSQKFSSLKMFFYRDLIAQAFVHSYLYSEAQLAGLSAHRRQYELRHLMRRLDDLLQNSRMIFTKREGEDAVIVYMTHLCVLIFRQLLSNKFQALLTPDVILLNNELIRPNSHSDYPQEHALISLYNWHQEKLPEIIDRFAGGGGLYSATNSRIDDFEKEYSKRLESLIPESIVTVTPAINDKKQQEILTNNAVAESNPLLSTAEASKLLGISPSGLLKQVKHGVVPHKRIGRLYKFDLQKINNLIQNKN